MSINADYRVLTVWERRILSRLLEPKFSGRDTLRVQLDQVGARTIDDDGSIKLKTKGARRAAVAQRVPTEAEAPDSDGVTIHYLLHVRSGLVNELEVYKEDLSRVLRHPDPAEVRLLTYQWSSNKGRRVRRGIPVLRTDGPRRPGVTGPVTRRGGSALHDERGGLASRAVIVKPRRRPTF